MSESEIARCTLLLHYLHQRFKHGRKSHLLQSDSYDTTRSLSKQDYHLLLFPVGLLVFVFVFFLLV